MSRVKDLSGLAFGRLTVKARAENDNHRRCQWICVCVCGKEKVVRGVDLQSGKTKSCGCYSLDRTKERATKHGMHKTRLYTEWMAMKTRCYNSHHQRYPIYGGRGITVCPEWRESFEAFRDWALANGYRDDLTLDRKDTDGNYCPENCRWATQKEQANNRRNTRLITYKGKTQTISQWSKETGIPHHIIAGRVSAGWTAEDIFTKEARKYHSRNLHREG